MLQYGVFFPLGGLDYLPGEKTLLLPTPGHVERSDGTPLGVAF